MREFNNIVSQILEHQKCIVINRHFINELERQGVDASKLRHENNMLEKEIEHLRMKSVMA